MNKERLTIFDDRDSDEEVPNVRRKHKKSFLDLHAGLIDDYVDLGTFNKDKHAAKRTRAHTKFFARHRPPTLRSNSGFNEIVPNEPADTLRPLESWQEVWQFLKPGVAPPLRTRELYLRVARFYLAHWIKTIMLSGLLMLFLVGYAQIPFARSLKSIDYYNPIMVATNYAISSALTVFLMAYGFWVLLYNFKKTKRLLYVVVPSVIWAAGNYHFFLLFDIEPWCPSLCIAHVIQEFASYVVFGVTVLITCAMMMRPAGQEAKHFMLIYGLPICVHLLITAAYSYIVLPFYRHMEDVQAKSAFRLIIHPILSFINTLVSQTWVREFQNTTPFLATGFVLGTYIASAVFGRLMILALGSPVATFYTAFIIGVVEVAVRATAKYRIFIIDFLFRKYCCTCPADPVDMELELELQGAYMHHSMTVDNAGIFLMTSMLAFFRPHRQVWNLAYTTFQPEIIDLIILGVIQLLVNLCTDYISTVLEEAQGIRTTRVIAEEPLRMFLWEFLNYIQMLTLILYVTRTLPFIGFCAENNPCTCRAGIDFDLFPQCNGTNVDPFF